MTGNQTSHITVDYDDSIDGAKIIRTYKISEDISRELDQKRDWWGRKLTGEKLQTWLEKQGCQLDSCSGPAEVQRWGNNATIEIYYRDGKRHREGGPAYFKRKEDGSTSEIYCYDGKPHRKDGPAVIVRDAGGHLLREGYYLNGKSMKKEDFAELSVIPDVTVQRPASKADRPGGPGPG
jgi:hypothetical protein